MNLRSKAREIKAAGAEARGNYTAEGAPLRAYNYWLEHSSSLKATRIKYGNERENFCHYWRVVAIWAPLTKLRVAVGPVGRWAGRHEDAIGMVAAGIMSLFVVFGLVLLAINLFQDGGWLFILYGILWVLATVAVIAVVFGIIWCLGSLTETLRGYYRVKKRERAAARPVKDTTEKSKAPRQPGRIARFFSGVGDFLVLIAQVVRVNKWKICPLVDVTPKQTVSMDK